MDLAQAGGVRRSAAFFAMLLAASSGAAEPIVGECTPSPLRHVGASRLGRSKFSRRVLPVRLAAEKRFEDLPGA